MTAIHDRLPIGRRRSRHVFRPEFPSRFVASASPSGARVHDWIERHLPELRETLLETGAVILRGFAIADHDDFAAIAARIGGPLDLGYTGPSPRTELVRGVHTASEVSSAVVVPEHAEMSYQRTLPRHLFFFCTRPAPVGGGTTLVDARRVLAGLDPDRVDPLLRAPLRIRRRHARPEGAHDPFELKRWPETFGTRDRDELLARVAAQGFEGRFEPDGSLTLEHEQAAVRTHPETFEPAWLNHLLVFHASTPTAILASAVRRERGLRSAAIYPLAAAYRALAPFLGREVATDVRLGDGGPIPDETVAHVREIVDREAVVVEWQRGDLVILDNHLVLHGRRPFLGRREVALAWSAARA